MSDFGTPEFLGLFGAVCLAIVVLIWFAVMLDELRLRWRASRHKSLRAAWRAWRQAK